MGVLRYSLGLSKQVGTKNHCFDSKISQYALIFCIQVEEKLCKIFYFLEKNQEKTVLVHVCHYHEVHLNSNNLKILLFQIIWTKIILSRNRVYYIIFPLPVGQILALTDIFYCQYRFFYFYFLFFFLLHICLFRFKPYLKTAIGNFLFD